MTIKLWDGWDKYNLADLDIPKEWEDVSYGNDLQPSFLIKGFQIFIAETDIAEREWDEMPRFTVQHWNYYGDCYTSRTMEDFSEVLEYVSNNFGAFIYIYK
tara:strand:+ start:356 stop:658 length:303 start_codon:yes stop_codon:yes gene_type:complete